MHRFGLWLLNSKLLFALSLILGLFFCSASHGDDLPAAIRTLRTDLIKLFQGDGSELEPQLWKAAMLTVNCVGQDEKVLLAALEEQGLKCVDTRENQHFDSKTYLVAENVFGGEEEPHYDLYLEMEIDRRDPKRIERAKPDKITTAEPVLRVALQTPLKKVMASDRFAKGSGVRRILEHDEVQKNAERYPELHALKISYGTIVDRWREDGIPSGHHVEVSLSKGDEGKKGVVKLFLTFENKDDPLRDWDGKVKDLNANKRDKVEDDLRFWGSVGPVVDNPFNQD